MSRLDRFEDILKSYEERKYEERKETSWGELLPGNIVMSLQDIVNKVSFGDENNMRQGFLMGEIAKGDRILVRDIIVPNQETGSAITKVTAADMIKAMAEADKMRHSHGYEWVGEFFYTNAWKPMLNDVLRNGFVELQKMSSTVKVLMLANKNLDFVIQRENMVYTK